LRAGKEKELDVEVGRRPSRDTIAKKSDTTANGQGAKLQARSGLSVEDLDAESRRELGVAGNLLGVLVTKVASASPAEDAGLRRGDIIVEVDQKVTPNVEAFGNVFHEERVYLLRIKRGDGYALTSLDLNSPAKRQDK
jgi:serine protease Do